MSSFFYQILHPWHWLTYGQNASGLGLVVLVFYTLYTRTMMLEAERARRGAMVPYLAINVNRRAKFMEDVGILNVGGPALHSQTFRIKNFDGFHVEPHGLRVPKDAVTQSLGLILKENSPTKLHVAPFSKGHPAFHVVECTDIFQQKHQLVIVCSYIDEQTCDYHTQWVQAETWSQKTFLRGAGRPVLNVVLWLALRRKRKAQQKRNET